MKRELREELPEGQSQNIIPDSVSDDEKERFQEKIFSLINTGEFEKEYFTRQFEEISSSEKSASFYGDLLELFAHLSFDEEEARQHWDNIFIHYEQLCAKLDRDVGLRLSIFDYFVNLNKSMENPFLVEMKLFQEAKQHSVYDPLTNIFNRRYFDLYLAKELRRARRYSKPLSILLMDLDNFKNINDTHGHLFGDEVLRNYADILKMMSREEDLVCRYGGEEFVIILPETEPYGAWRFANRLIEGMKKDPFFAQYKITFSGGIAAYPDGGDNPEQLISNADESLYRAKLAGKNQVLVSKLEKRKAFRYSRTWQILEQPIEIRSEKCESTACITHNISLKGVRIESDREFAAGDKVHLEFNLPGEEQIMISGEIIWARKDKGLPYTFGVKYLDITAEHQKQLEKILPVQPLN